MAEDAMYRRSEDLNRSLHELEASLESLTARIHVLLCRGGRMPLPERAERILEAVEAFEKRADLSSIREIVDRVLSLRAIADGYEAELDAPPEPVPPPLRHPVLEAVVAAAG
jgi:hypothetical protein